ncbi:MAG: hypothetical protein ABJ388_09820 [Alphaproteobacteria bacterium]
MTARPHIAYLDQNKWVELACAVKSPASFPAQHALLKAINREIDAGHLVLPITATNIYETHKINDPERRHELAVLQATTSRGLVFCGRYRRLEKELNDLWCVLFDQPHIVHRPHWFLSNIFFEAFADIGDPRMTDLCLTEETINILRADPIRPLYEYLVALSEDVRVEAVKKFTDGSEDLRQRIEKRRCQHAGESLALRRKIQSALLMINENELILAFANRAGFTWKSIGEIGDANVRRIIEEVPTYYVEREIALRLEAETRPIEENDFRDMQSFCAVIPYADEVIGEKHFVNLARQANLDKKYETRLSTNILDLAESLERLGATMEPPNSG